MAKANSKPAAKPAAKPNTSATAQTGNTAEVSATVATPAAPLQNPSNSAHGDEEKLPPVGEGSAADKLDDVVVDGVIVTSEVEGFRRAGRAWSRTPTTVPMAELDEETIKVLEAEPLLSVAYLAADTEKTAG